MKEVEKMAAEYMEAEPTYLLMPAVQIICSSFNKWPEQSMESQLIWIFEARNTEDALHHAVRDFISWGGNLLCIVPAAEERSDEKAA